MNLCCTWGKSCSWVCTASSGGGGWEMGRQYSWQPVFRLTVASWFLFWMVDVQYSALNLLSSLAWKGDEDGKHVWPAWRWFCFAWQILRRCKMTEEYVGAGILACFPNCFGKIVGGENPCLFLKLPRQNHGRWKFVFISVTALAELIVHHVLACNCRCRRHCVVELGALVADVLYQGQIN